MSEPRDPRQSIRAAISNAYYETREAGGTMEAAADHATASVMDILGSALDCVSALRYHNRKPGGGTRKCLSGCIACAALAAFDAEGAKP